MPVLRVMYDTRFRMPITVDTLNLAKPGTQDRILRSVDPEDYKIDVRKFLL